MGLQSRPSYFGNGGSLRLTARWAKDVLGLGKCGGSYKGVVSNFGVSPVSFNRLDIPSTNLVLRTDWASLWALNALRRDRGDGHSRSSLSSGRGVAPAIRPPRVRRARDLCIRRSHTEAGRLPRCIRRAWVRYAWHARNPLTLASKVSARRSAGTSSLRCGRRPLVGFVRHRPLLQTSCICRHEDDMEAHSWLQP